MAHHVLQGFCKSLVLAYLSDRVDIDELYIYINTIIHDHCIHTGSLNGLILRISMTLSVIQSYDSERVIFTICETSFKYQKELFAVKGVMEWKDSVFS